MMYKYSHKTIGDIGRDLGVDYVLEGSVRRWGSKVRITAQLVQVNENLQASETRLRTVIAHAPIVLYAVDAAGVFTLCEGRALGDIGLI